MINLLATDPDELRRSPALVGDNERVSGLCEDFFPEVASSATFDGVQVLVNP